MIKTIIGDLIKDMKNYDVIIHGCNCFSVMGAGIARQVRKFIPEAYEVDKNSPLSPLDKLGSFTHTVLHVPTIVNAYTQYDFKNKNDVEYCAIRSSLREIKSQFTGKKIALPMIGAGLAGGNWDVIKKIIDKELKDEDVTIIIWSEDVANYKYADTYQQPSTTSTVSNSRLTMDDLF